MELDEVREQKALRDENARLKRLVADEALNIQVPKEVTSKNDEPVAAPPRGRKRGCGGPLFVPADVPYLGLARSSLAYRRKPPTQGRVQTEAAIVELSRKHPRYGIAGCTRWCCVAAWVERGARCNECVDAKACACSAPRGDRVARRARRSRSRPRASTTCGAWTWCSMPRATG
jgi:hypothetical protein